MEWLNYIIAFVTGTFWSFVAALICVTIAMYLISNFEISGWWAIGSGVVIVGLLMLIPHGYHLMDLMFSSHPTVQLMTYGFPEDQLKTLVEYRFWGGIAGCFVGVVGWDHFFGDGRR